MPFKSPPWAHALPHEVPDTLSVAELMLDENHRRYPLINSRPPFVCGITGNSPSALEVEQRVDYLSRGLAKEFGWQPNSGEALDKVTCIFSLNTIDYLPVIWAVHRLGGVVAPANAQSSGSDLVALLSDCGASSIFTCLPLLDKAMNAAAAVGIPKSRVYLLALPEGLPNQASGGQFLCTNQLAALGEQEEKLQILKWKKGEGKRRVAFLCYSSGTSGLPKGVKISHYNVIYSILQVCAFEQASRDRVPKTPGDAAYMENVLGLLPLSHIYGLIMISHCAAWRGDSTIILPRFELKQCLRAIQNYKINTLFLVPPIIILMMKNQDLLRQYDLSSVRAIFTGAAPVRPETAEQMNRIYPKWLMRQAYGLTETCSVVSSSADFDIWLGSAGSLVTGVEARLISPEGAEITEYDRPGELWVKSPSVALGYLNNDAADEETFVTDEQGDRWVRTGDEVAFRKGPRGYDHLFVVDRIKELIKVKGQQVAPAELEAHLLLSPDVADCAVIATPDDDAGEVPKAYVVKSAQARLLKSSEEVRRDLFRHVEENKSHYKWLRGGIEFLDVVPKSPSGKILRRLLKQKDVEDREKKQAKL